MTAQLIPVIKDELIAPLFLWVKIIGFVMLAAIFFLIQTLFQKFFPGLYAAWVRNKTLKG